MVQTESTMARVLGIKVRGTIVFATFSLYLVPSHSHLGLFLDETPCSLVIPGFRFFTVSAIMIKRITMSPAVVPISVDGWPCAVIFVEIG